MVINDFHKPGTYPVVLSPYEYPKIEEKEVYFLTESRIAQKVRAEFRQGKVVPKRMRESMPETTKYNATQIIIAATILYLFILLHSWIYAGAYLFVLALYIYRNKQEDKRKIINYHWRQENIIKENNRNYDEFMDEEKKLILKAINEDSLLMAEIRNQVYSQLLTKELSKYKAEKPTNIQQTGPYLITNSITGKTESYFFNALKKYFASKDIEISMYCQLGFYYPDIVFIHSSGLIIDIEIDEPYTLPGKKPVHFFDSNSGYHSDHSRNSYFLDKGWIVIRFTEKQIIEETEACCYEIDYILSKYVFSETRYKFHGLVDDVYMWTEEEALKWSEIDYRNSYLPIKLKYDPNKLTDFIPKSFSKSKRLSLDYYEDFDYNGGLPF